MAIVKRDRSALDFAELWRRMFDNDLEAGGWLRIEEYRDGDTFVLRAELPGIDPEHDVDLTVTDGVLRITARKQERHEQKDNGSYRSEFRYGTFVRDFVLPDGVKEQDISASYKDGVLEVRVPVKRAAQEQQQKKIPVVKQ
jgi:HSP20 family protein